MNISDVTTDIVKSLIRQSKDPAKVFAGIHNAFVHGDIFEELGLDFTDAQLGDFFNGIDLAQKAIKGITNGR